MTTLGASGLLGGPSPDDVARQQTAGINPKATTQRVSSGRGVASVALVGQAGTGTGHGGTGGGGQRPAQQKVQR